MKASDGHTWIGNSLVVGYVGAANDAIVKKPDGTFARMEYLHMAGAYVQRDVSETNKWEDQQ